MYSTGALIRNTYFEQGLNLIAPADASAISYFAISYCYSQEYCTYFLFPLFLVSSAVISSYFCEVVAILKTNFRCQYYCCTCVTTSV